MPDKQVTAERAKHFAHNIRINERGMGSGTPEFIEKLAARIEELEEAISGAMASMRYDDHNMAYGILEDALTPTGEDNAR